MITFLERKKVIFPQFCVVKEFSTFTAEESGKQVSHIQMAFETDMMNMWVNMIDQELWQMTGENWSNMRTGRWSHPESD